MAKIPKWKPPENIAAVLESGDGYFEDEQWSPLRLTIMSGTEVHGREVPVAWQMELDPSEEAIQAANAKLELLGIEPDGYGWCEHIRKTIQRTNPALAKRLHLTDCESATCVIWVESEVDCRDLLEATWDLIFNS